MRNSQNHGWLMGKIDGTLLRQERQRKGISIRQLAERAGVNKSTITRIEKGEMSPTIEVFEKILSAMSIGIQLVYEDEKTDIFY